EAKAISAARDQVGNALKLWSIWEADGNVPESFTGENGERHAKEAVKQAKAAGQPEKSGLYFAVDFPARTRQGADHFNAVAGTVYRVGVYGDGTVCNDLLHDGHVQLAFLAGASAWPGSNAFMDWNIRQSPPITDPIVGIEIDQCSLRWNDAGCWAVPDVPPKLVVVTTRIGDSGPRVEALQKRLQKWGSSVVQVNGNYDQKTWSAVAMYQRSNGLVPDGIAGPLTWASLVKLIPTA